MHSQPVGRVTEVLGEIDDPGMEIEIAVRKYEVPHIFSDAALAQAAALPSSVGAADRKGRVDLTDVALVTIDGEDARDFDDAVYCEPVRIGKSKVDNGWRLIVAIADVSHYVRPGEPIDLDAYERATSVYFPRRVIPMLPEKLSNGLCSLNPEVERLAMVCDMLVDQRRRGAGVPVLPGGDPLGGALHLHRGGGDPRQHARPGSGAPHRARAAPARPARRLPRAAQGARQARRDRLRDHRDADRLRRERPDREDRPAHAQRGAPADRGVDARRQRLLGRLHRPRQASGALSRPRRAHAREEDAAAELPEGARPGPVDRRRPDAGRVPGDRGGDQGAARRGADPPDAAALDAAGDLHEQEHRPLRPRLRGLHALHEPDPALSRPARAPRHQGAARQPPLRDRRARRGRAGEEGAPRQGGEDGEERQGGHARRCRRSPPAASSRRGRSPARTAAPTSAAPTKPRATSRPGSSAATCASISARSSAARSAR